MDSYTANLWLIEAEVEKWYQNYNCFISKNNKNLKKNSVQYGRK